MLEQYKLFTSFDFPDHMTVGDKIIKFKTDGGLDIHLCVYDDQKLIYARECEAFFVDRKNRLILFHSICLTAKMKMTE